MGCLQPGTRKSLTATEGGASELDPRERIPPGMSCVRAAAATSWQVETEEGMVCEILEPDNLRVCWEDPLLNGVY